MLPTKFQFIWPCGLRGEDFIKLANQKQELPVVAMFVNRSELNKQSL
jgi:lipoate-protein ligase B